MKTKHGQKKPIRTHTHTQTCIHAYTVLLIKLATAIQTVSEGKPKKSFVKSLKEPKNKFQMRERIKQFVDWVATYVEFFF